jgi:formylmethanofuran dehydrogenase subunit C
MIMAPVEKKPGKGTEVAQAPDKLGNALRRGPQNEGPASSAGYLMQGGTPIIDKEVPGNVSGNAGYGMIDGKVNLDAGDGMVGGKIVIVSGSEAIRSVGVLMKGGKIVIKGEAERCDGIVEYDPHAPVKPAGGRILSQTDLGGLIVVKVDTPGCVRAEKGVVVIVRGSGSSKKEDE